MIQQVKDLQINQHGRNRLTEPSVSPAIAALGVKV